MFGMLLVVFNVLLFFSDTTDVCMVFEVLSSNLLDLIIKSDYCGIPLENVRCIIKQVKQSI